MRQNSILFFILAAGIIQLLWHHREVHRHADARHHGHDVHGVDVHHEIGVEHHGHRRLEREQIISFISELPIAVREGAVYAVLARAFFFEVFAFHDFVIQRIFRFVIVSQGVFLRKDFSLELPQICGAVRELTFVAVAAALRRVEVLTENRFVPFVVCALNRYMFCLLSERSLGCQSSFKEIIILIKLDYYFLLFIFKLIYTYLQKI